MSSAGVSTTHTAQKEHKCSWCGEKIEIGDKYHNWSVFDRGVHRCKAHVECYVALSESPRDEYDMFSQQRGVPAV